jgi:cell wall-associated NlpC family hydrolase
MGVVLGLVAVDAAPALAAEARCAPDAKAGFARTQLFVDADCRGGSMITKGRTEMADFRRFINYDGKTYNVDNSRSSLAIQAGTCVRLYDLPGYRGDASTPICAGSRTLYWNLTRFDDRASSMRICAASDQAACGPGPSTPPPSSGPAPAPAPAPAPPPAAAPAPAPAPSGTTRARRAVDWTVRHAPWWAGKYSMKHRLPTHHSVAYMQRNAPPRGGRQACDCSSFLRWAMAQAGVDIGTYTKDNWTARGRMPARYTSSSASTPYGRVLRGQGTTPPGGFKVGDLVFYGVSGMGTGTGHIALYIGDGKIAHCNGSRGSNVGMSMDYHRRTGWVRYVAVSG